RCAGRALPGAGQFTRADAVRAARLFLPRSGFPAWTPGLQPHGRPARQLGQGARRLTCNLRLFSWLPACHNDGGQHARNGAAPDKTRGGRATTRPAEGRQRGGAMPWRLSGFADKVRAQFDRCLAADLAPGRPILWLPIAFGSGIILYFTAAHEPFWWAGLGLTSALAAAAIARRASVIGFPLLVALAAIAAGFTTATMRSRL